VVVKAGVSAQVPSNGPACGVPAVMRPQATASRAGLVKLRPAAGLERLVPWDTGGGARGQAWSH
jgi:hypothetical protein